MSYRPTIISIGQQVGRMATQYPHFDSQWRHSTITWRGWLHPTPLSNRYEIRVTYSLGSSPDVRVLSPSLQKGINGEDVPHTYSISRPCLYLPGTREWGPEKYIASTILPWTLLWLYYYEVWRATGTWEGGGVHPEQPDNN